MTHILRWKPFSDLPNLHGSFDQLFNETFGRMQPGLGESFDHVNHAAWAPAVDTLETDDALLLRADVPGVTPEDVDIEVHDNVLTLSGERKVETDVKEENFHRVERNFGSFRRRFTLPRTVDAEKIEASYHAGVLEIKLPKRPEAKPRQIKVAVNSN